jgi:hypothetical protein
MAIASFVSNKNFKSWFLLGNIMAIASVTVVLGFSNDKSFPRILKERYLYPFSKIEKLAEQLRNE